MASGILSGIRFFMPPPQIRTTPPRSLVLLSGRFARQLARYVAGVTQVRSCNGSRVERHLTEGSTQPQAVKTCLPAAYQTGMSPAAPPSSRSTCRATHDGVGVARRDRGGRRDHAGRDDFLEAIARVAQGGTVLDPEVVRHLLGASRRADSLAALTRREREVLSLMAEGRSNVAIADALVISPGVVE